MDADNDGDGSGDGAGASSAANALLKSCDLKERPLFRRVFEVELSGGAKRSGEGSDMVAV